MICYGLGASDGAAVGRAYIYRPFTPVIENTVVPPEDRAAVIKGLENAKKSAVEELRQIIDDFYQLNSAEGKIFQAHLELLEDEDVWQEILDEASEGANGKLAIHQVYSQYIEIMSANPDPMMQERAADLRDVRNRLLRNLVGLPERNLSKLPGPVVILAHDLLPADTATMDRENVLAIVTEIGGRTSHTAILSRSYRIPAVLGIPDIMATVSNGQLIAVDGSSGEVVTDPSEAIQKEYDERLLHWKQQLELNSQYLLAPCQTSDGVHVDIGANIGDVSPEIAKLADSVDLIGLFRTEFLYMKSDKLPTEEQQFDAYSQLLRVYGSKPVTLRTLDVGGDKALPCLTLPKEDNPFLGKRALRLCLDREDLFTVQLRAAFRASIFGNLWIMFPMVGTVDDWRKAKAIAERVRQELIQEGVPVADNVKMGIMIEVPSAAIMAEELAAEVDFASIGTNDLCQYTLAVDRGNPDLSQYYQMYSPAVFRLIAHVTNVFRKAGKPICVCGELGGDEAAAMALVGMGMRKLSMSGSSVAAVKRRISEKTIGQLEELAAQTLACATAEDLEACLKASM